MRLRDLFSKDAVLINQIFNNKQDVFSCLVQLQDNCGNLKNKDDFLNDILLREQQLPTAIERGIVIPHAKSSAVKNAFISVITLKKSIDCNAMDNQFSDLFFMIAAPQDNDLHIKILSRLVTLLMDDGFTKSLRFAKSIDEFLDIVDVFENDKFEHEIDVFETRQQYKILAVTACPTGIAHTFMAAEALEKAAKKHNVTIKVETNGSDEAKNKLTEQDIQQADAIIVAADIAVDLKRFHSKPVLFCSVIAGVHNADELITNVMQSNCPIYIHKDNDGDIEYSKTPAIRKNLTSKLYSHLMTGISYMIPFVVGGGVLIALSYALDDLSIGALTFGMNTPLAAFFRIAGTTTFRLMLPILSAFIGYSIADRAALVPAFIGGIFALNGFATADMALTNVTTSGFFGAILAGFLSGYIIKGLKILFLRLPKSFNGLKSTFLYPIISIVLISFIMLSINPFVNLITEHITLLLNYTDHTNRILLGCVLGAMMSVDMGGPINKVAYLFGTASLITADYDIMASVMIGGMVPPLAIALAATFFKNKFTTTERRGAYANYILGLCFVTEGAVPYVATDPLRVLPACMFGSGLAGALSMIFHCQIFAPHGGIFIFPLAENIFYYVISLLVGCITAALIIGFTKKNVKTFK